MTSYPGEPPDPAGRTEPRVPTATFAADHGPADYGPHQDHHEDHHEDAGYRPDWSDADLAHLYGPAGGDEDKLWAMMAYLGLIFFAFAPPLAVYLAKRRESRYVRYHAAQALNLWLTTFLYSVSFLIIGGILAFDTISAALAISLPLISAAGIVMLSYAIRAALAANRGSLYRIPGWICAIMAR